MIKKQNSPETTYSTLRTAPSVRNGLTSQARDEKRCDWPGCHGSISTRSTKSGCSNTLERPRGAGQAESHHYLRLGKFSLFYQYRLLHQTHTVGG